MSRRRAALLGLALLAAIGAGPAVAQAPAAPPQAVDTPEKVVAVTVNKSRLVRLPAAVRDVVVANPAIADVVVRTPNVIYILGRSVGETSVVFLDAQGREVEALGVRVEFDVAALRTALRQAMPNEPVTVSAANQSIVLNGTASTPAAADSVRQVARQFVANDNQLVSVVKVGSDQQVLLRVRVAEVSREVVKQLGVSSAVLSNNTPVGTPAAIAAATSTANQGVNFSAGRALVNPTAFATFLGDIVVGGIGRLSLTLEALEQTGLVKTLAEPNLTAISGETASFLAGGEFPVPVPQDANTITIQYKQFGVRVNFTPVVVSPGVISLKVATEVSALSDNGAVTLGNFRISALTVRRADTTVELPSGGSLVIAGLLQNNMTTNFEGIPGLKDVPVLGQLFRSTKFQRDETELVVTVTPILTRTADPLALALPTDGFGPTDDVSMYFLEKLYATYRGPAPRPTGTLRGPVGFVLE
jgi:pilus assembly protein CpaC